MKTALIIGSTGLIGSQLVQLLLESDEYGKIITFVKRDTGLQHPKLTQHIIDFNKPESYKNWIVGDDLFCTIGTTIKNAGSKEAFRKVDYDYPSQFAAFASENKVKHFLIISSLGADRFSSNFYLKTKGEIEAFLGKCAFESVSILRPSLLLGNRNEFRLGEKIGAFFMQLFSFLLVGSLRKYKAIQSQTVAKALLKFAIKNEKGVKIYESDAIENSVKLQS